MTEQNYSYQKIDEFIQSVIEWNKVIDNNETSPERIELQKTITLEEINETIAAIEANDVIEIIDGVGDILVTAGYLKYLVEGNFLLSHETIVCSTKDNNFSEEYLEGTIQELSYLILDLNKVSYILLQEMCACVIYLYGEQTVVPYFDAILKSNWSKFIPKREFDWITEHQHYLENYAHRYENVKPVETMDYILLRAVGGKGKLIKPSRYKEPAHFLQ